MAEQRLIDANNVGNEMAIEWQKTLVKEEIADAPTIDPETLPIVRQLREELKNEIAKKQICGEVIERLDKQLEKVTAERDAAMSFIPKTCATCKYGKSPCDWCTTDPDGYLNWEWNGKRKEAAI